MMPGLPEVVEAAGLTLFERGWLSSNSLLFEQADSGSAALVDSGYWIHQAQIVELVRTLARRVTA